METANALEIISPEKIGIALSDLPNALALNKTSVEKATAAARGLLDTIEAEGMNDALDADINKVLVKLRATKDIMMERRKGGTQLMDLIKKEFTGLENLLDPKNENSVYAKLQASRDAYATQKANEARKKEEEVKRKFALDKEVIQINSEIQVQLENYFSNYLGDQLRLLRSNFDSMTLENFPEKSAAIKTFATAYPFSHFSQFKPSLRLVYMSQPDADKLFAEFRVGKHEGFQRFFEARINELKDVLIDQLASKKDELNAIAEEKKKAEALAELAKQEKNKKLKAEMEAKAKEAEAEQKRMEDEAAQRKANEEEKLRIEAQERENDTATKAESSKQASMTNALFEAQAELQTAPQNNASVRESYEIEVLNPLGYLLIAQFFFEKDGKTESVAKLEKKTLGSMKKYCEAYALAHDEKIESVFLKYNEKYKTVAKKA